MTIKYASGETETVENEDEAREILDAKYPEAVYSDEQSGRILVWENEDESENDDGANAVAEIIFPLVS